MPALGVSRRAMAVPALPRPSTAIGARAARRPVEGGVKDHQVQLVLAFRGRAGLLAFLERVTLPEVNGPAGVVVHTAVHVVVQRQVPAHNKLRAVPHDPRCARNTVPAFSLLSGLTKWL